MTTECAAAFREAVDAQLYRTVANNVGTITYDYDVAGNKVAMQPPSLAASCKSILYGYDADNRLSTVTHPDGFLTRFAYDKVGNRQSVTRQNASSVMFGTTRYTYDALNRLTDLVNTNSTGAVLSSYHYQLWADGKRLSVTDGTGTTTLKCAKRRAAQRVPATSPAPTPTTL